MSAGQREWSADDVPAWSDNNAYSVQRAGVSELLTRVLTRAEEERRLRRESETLLAAVRIINQDTPFAERCYALMSLFQDLYPIDGFALLVRVKPRELSVVYDSGMLRGDRLPLTPLVREVLGGRRLVSQDLHAGSDFDPAQLGMRQNARTLLASNLPFGEVPAIIILSSAQPGSADAGTLGMLEQILELAGSLLESERQRLARLRLRQAARQGDMLAEVAHELISPINAIQILIANARRDGVRNSDELLTRIEELGRQAIGSATVIRDLARPRTMLRDGGSICVNEVIERFAELFLQPQLAREDIALELDLESRAGRVVLPDGALHQILFNLVSNARDAIRARRQGDATAAGRIEVRICKVSGSPARIAIAVSDNGGGLTEDLLDCAFESWVTTKGEGGSGLGLAICREIVVRAGGEIAIRNVAGGACVECLLDVAEPAVASAQAPFHG